MLDNFFIYLSQFDEFLWTSIAIPITLILGLLLTFRLKFTQFSKLREIFRNLKDSLNSNGTQEKGVHPMKVFFASIGGCIGIGNIVAVCTAIQIGGPGAVFWIWIASLLGMIIKYSEVYLGVRYRITNSENGYDGGPMYYLQKAFRAPMLPIVFSVLLAIYGTEIYMFNVVTYSIVENLQINQYFVIILLLALILYASSGGISRVGTISTLVVSIFLVVFSAMSLWVLFNHLAEIPSLLSMIVHSAFTGHAPLGGFAGSGLILAMSQGIARGCYSGDIGIGYAAIVHAETRHIEPKKQAQLAILGIFLDTFIVCTFSTLLILVTGVWNQDIPASHLVQRALEQYFPYMDLFMPLFLFLLGYSTLIAFFCAGLKCAKFIHPRYGKSIYYVYAISAFVLFSFLEQSYALTVMSLSGALLLTINLIGIFKLRKEVLA